MEVIKYGKFLRSIYKKNQGKHVPVKAMIELTYKCNHKCIHCYNPEQKQKPEMTTEQVFSVIDQLKELGVLQIAYTGGEIFVREDIMDILFYTRKQGMRVSLLTNASLITEQIADQLIEWGITSFEISFLGATKETFDQMTQIDGSFDKVVSVVKMLRKKGVIPKIKTCVTNINVDEADRIADLSKELDVSFSYSPLVIPRLDFGQDPGSLRIAPDEFLDISKRFKRFAKRKAAKKEGQKNKKREPRLGFWERDCIFNCMAGKTGIFINPYGKMLSCMTVPDPAFDIFELGAKKCWEKVVEFVHTVKPPKDWECYTCEYQDWCSWCPGRGILNTGNIFGCPPYFKELAKERMRRYQERVAQKQNLEASGQKPDRQ